MKKNYLSVRCPGEVGGASGVFKDQCLNVRSRTVVQTHYTSHSSDRILCLCTDRVTLVHVPVGGHCARSESDETFEACRKSASSDLLHSGSSRGLEAAVPAEGYGPR